MGPGGIQWDPLGSVGIQWHPVRSSGIRWDLKGSGGIRWDPVGSGGIQWDPVGSNGIRWDPMGSGGIQWEPVGSSEIPWDQAGSVWIQWDPVGPSGSPQCPERSEHRSEREHAGKRKIPSENKAAADGGCWKPGKPEDPEHRAGSREVVWIPVVSEWIPANERAETRIHGCRKGEGAENSNSGGSKIGN